MLVLSWKRENLGRGCLVVIWPQLTPLAWPHEVTFLPATSSPNIPSGVTSILAILQFAEHATLCHAWCLSLLAALALLICCTNTASISKKPFTSEALLMLSA